MQGPNSRRSTLLVGTAAAFLGLLAPASNRASAAEEFPSRPIRMIVPFGAGTTTDIVSRVVGNGVAMALGQPVVIENRAGAGGSIGTAAVAKSSPDGYTLVMGTVGTHAINAGLFSRLPYDPIRDFVPIALVGYTPTLLVVPEGLPVKGAGDLVVLAKSRPAGVSFASAGNGTSGHLAGELLKVRSGGTQMQHVPYKDGGMAVTDVIAGRVDFMFYHPAAVMPHVRSGQLRAIGVSSARRAQAAPDVPTLVEQGFGDFDLIAWFALYAPAETPPAVLTRLRDAASRALASAEVAPQLAQQGVEQISMTGEQLASFLGNELGKWSELVRISGARLE